MSEADNAAVARRFYEDAINGGDLDVLDEITAPEALLHAPLAGLRPGPEGLRQVVASLRKGFPDIHVLIDDLITAGDKVVVRWRTDRQTHEGPYRGIPPTGKEVQTTAIQIFRVVEGRIHESWLELDALGGARQMRVVPPEEISTAGRAFFVLGSLPRFAFLEARHGFRNRKTRKEAD